MTKNRTQDEVRQLRERASAFLEAGKKKDAAACYEKLALLEPASGDWPRRAADCYGELGRASDQRKALLVALRAYGRSGQVLKAIAMGKLALRIFPGDAEVLRELELVEAPAKAPALPVRGGGFHLPAAPFRPPAVPPAAPPESEQPGVPSVGPSRRPSVKPEAPPPSGRAKTAGAVVRSIIAGVSSRRSPVPLPPDAPVDPPGMVCLDAGDIVSAELDTPVALPPQEVAFGALAGARLFSELGVAQRMRLVETVDLVTLGPGEVLLQQGAPADSMYVVVEGEVLAQVATSAPGGTLELATLGAGEFFGEIGLLGDQPRQASIIAKTEVTLLEFGREAMARLVEGDERFRYAVLRFLRERLVETLMLTSPLFQPFGPDDRATLQRLFRFVEVSEGTTLLEEGRKADGLYVLLAGEVVVRKGGGGEGLLLGSLSPGDVFGEMSLLKQKPAMASVVARTRCYALRLPDRYFMEVLMTHPVLMEHIATLGATRAEQNAALLSPASSLEDAHVTLF